MYTLVHGDCGSDVHCSVHSLINRHRRDWPLQMHYNGFGDIQHQISHGDNRYRLDLLTLIDSMWLTFSHGVRG